MTKNNHLVIAVSTSESLAQINSEEASSFLEIPVTSGQISPEFMNASWGKIRDEIYVYPFRIGWFLIAKA